MPIKNMVLGFLLLLGAVLSTKPAEALTVNPGDTVKVDNFLPAPLYPYSTSGLWFFGDAALAFNYSLFDGTNVAPILSGGASGSSGIIHTAVFTLQNSTAYILLTSFNQAGTLSGAGLYAPELFAGNCQAGCTPLRQGSLAVVSAVPVPAALPLLASGLGALGFIGWRTKRKAA